MDINQEERLRTLYALEKFYEFEKSQWIDREKYEAFSDGTVKQHGAERRSRLPSWENLMSTCFSMTEKPRGIDDVYRSIIAYRVERDKISKYLNRGIDESIIIKSDIETKTRENTHKILQFMERQISCPPSSSRNIFTMIKNYSFFYEEKECLNSITAFLRKLSDSTQIFRGITSKVSIVMIRGLGDFYIATDQEISMDTYERLRPGKDSEELAEEIYSRGRLRGLMEFFRFAAASCVADPSGGKKKTSRGQDLEIQNMISKLKTDNSLMKNIIDSLYTQGGIPEDIYSEMIHRTRASESELLAHFRSRLQSHFGIKIDQKDAEGINANARNIKTIAWSRSTRSPFVKLKIRDAVVYAILTKDRKGEYVLTTAYTESMFLKDADMPSGGDTDEFLRNRKGSP